jgi:hypothetical protein
MAKITVVISVDERGAFRLAGLDGSGDLCVAFSDIEDEFDSAVRTVKLSIEVPHEAEALHVAIPAVDPSTIA